MKLFLLATILLLCVPPLNTCKTVLRVKKRAMEHACQTHRSHFEGHIRKMSFPDLEGIANFFIGKALSLTGIQIFDVKLPNMKVNLVPGVGVQVTLESSLHIKGILLFANVDIKVDSGITADVSVTKTSGGLPLLKVSACKSALGQIQVTASGINLISPMVSAIQGHIHAMISKQLCLTVSNVFVDANVNLQLMCANHINEHFELQYNVPTPPVVKNDYVEMNMYAQYKVEERVLELPTGAQEFTLPPPDASAPDSMVTMAIPRDFFSSIFAALHTSKKFSLTIPASTSSLINELKTSYVGSYIPEISRKYHESLAVGIKISLSQVPVVTFQSSQLAIQLTSSVELFAVSPRSGNEHMLTFSVGVTLAAKLDVSVDKLKISVSIQKELSVSLASSSIGQCGCTSSSVSGYMQTVFEKAYLIHINEVLSIGVALPALPNMNLIQPVFDIKKDYAVMSCDVQYT
ncbi:BPI fold-containing family B member 2 [Xenopus tropicalis]|uniref:BPI fold-containing family B member 2 n=1 Tax=Xenopus tropicalis TaxID=8364 RepID=A0A803JDY6_XENTR|nr:BPI fold-containing family B member 2 [Xenopus tropicalis]XP_031750271.1 BPI fold-containing family B member 2 [Xenopus tropicalis]